MIIGLTGGIGSGKSTIAQCFRDLGVSVTDADQMTRTLVAPKQPALDSIVEHFGSTILQKDGTLNRARLRNIIFESTEERQWLEKLLHPLVKEQISKHSVTIPPGEYWIVEAPLLIEAHFQDAVDRILVIDCPESMQIDRIIKRDATPRDTIQAMMKSQTTRAHRLAEADDVIENIGTIEDLKPKVKALHHYYIGLSK